GLAEMIKSGTTTFLDMYFYEDVIAETTLKAGIRGFLGFPIIDFDTPEYCKDNLIPECERFIKKWMNNRLITPVIAPHGTYTCNPETLDKVYDLSEKYKTLLHTHCSETREEVYDVEHRYGVRPVEQLKKHGLLSDRMILAHCGWITKNEITELKKSNSAVSHCPVSNMKIATGGYAPLPELIDADVKTSLGTDGAASNNTLDMFETMKFTALIHKHHRWDPTVLPAQTVLDLATIGGAKSLHMDNKIGSLEEGKKADIIIIDAKKPHLTPLHDPISHLTYAAKGSDVSHVIVDGKTLMLDYELVTIDQDKIIDDATQCTMDLIDSKK
ncbi:MAG: amidohydrolase, partial [Candidatus Thermoplasmatota archaeon]